MKENSTKRMTRKERRNAPARQSPRDTPELRREILRLIRGGMTMTELCGRDDMPPLATLFDWKRADPVFDAAFQEALEDHTTALLSDAMEQSQAVADAAVDADSEPVNPADTPEPVRAGSANIVNRAKAAEFYLNSALKYAGAMAPQKYGTLVKSLSQEVGNGVSITITSYATKASEECSSSASGVGGQTQVLGAAD